MKLFVADCLDTIAQLDDASVQLFVLDPPFFMGNKPFVNENMAYERVVEDWDNQWNNQEEYQDWCAEWVNASVAKMSEGASMLVFSSFHSNAVLQRVLDDSGLVWRNFITWFVPNATPILRAKQMGIYAHSCLYIFYYSKGPVDYFNYDYAKRLNGGAQHRDIIVMERCPHSERVGHPTQKSVKFLERLILTHSPPKGLVVDFFMGSGSAAEAAITNNRRFIGGDRDSCYYEMAVNRFIKLQSNLMYKDVAIEALKGVSNGN